MDERTKYYIAGSLVGLIPQPDIKKHTESIIDYTKNISSKYEVERIVKGILIQGLDEKYYSQAVKVSKDISNHIVANRENRSVLR